MNRDMKDHHDSVDMIARNSEMQRAREWFMQKHPCDAVLIGTMGASEYLDKSKAVHNAWKAKTGYDRFMKRVGNSLYRRLGYEPCGDAPGWRKAA